MRRGNIEHAATGKLDPFTAPGCMHDPMSLQKTYIVHALVLTAERLAYLDARCLQQPVQSIAEIKRCRLVEAVPSLRTHGEC